MGAENLGAYTRSLNLASALGLIQEPKKSAKEEVLKFNKYRSKHRNNKKKK